MRDGGLERVLFAGGGTGGHIYMGVALAAELKKRNEAAQVLFVGTPRGLEGRILPPLGHRLEMIQVGALNSVHWGERIKTLLQLPGSIWASRRLLRRFRPSVVVGLGGYSSGPVILAARLLGIPSLLIEPNARVGLTNRLLRRWVSRAAVAFEETQGTFGPKAIITGIPIREAFFGIQSGVAAEGPLRLLVFGGSQGSHAINRLVCDALPHLEPGLTTWVHQTGPKDRDWVQARYDAAGAVGQVVEFIYDMPERFAQADLIVSRSGASTIAEITASGRPALLIPFPHSADDHQRRNAEALERRGAAKVLEQEQAGGRDVAEWIATVAADRRLLHDMAAAAKQLARPDSTRSIIELMEELALPAA